MEEATTRPQVESEVSRHPDGPHPDPAGDAVRLAWDSIQAMQATIRDEVLCDEQGPIPKFPVRRAFDEQGRYIPMSPEERAAREDAYQRVIKIRRQQPDTEPPGLDEAIMRGIDSHREEGMKLFEGYY